MQTYLVLLRDVLKNGEKRQERTGTGTLSVFGYHTRYDLAEGFPLLTTKRCHLRSIIHELLWFLRGDTNIEYLRDKKVTIWDEWADESGELGPIYGYQWRHWSKEKPIDQIQQVIAQLKNDPYSRRHVVSAWNAPDISNMALPPCHVLFQFYVHQNEKLSCQLYQRSADIFLGVPFNIASYALLTLMISQVLGLRPGHFIHTIGDAHLYLNHLDQAKLQLTRPPRTLPTLQINPEVKNIFEFRFDDFELLNYNPHPTIKAPISV